MTTERRAAASTVGEPRRIDWYARCDELQEGQMFRLYDGRTFVKLDRRVPGDGTLWYAATWSGYWCYDDFTVEPSDLRERIQNEVDL